MGKKKRYPGSYCTYTQTLPLECACKINVKGEPVLDISWITIHKYNQNKIWRKYRYFLKLSDLALSSPTFAENLKTIHSEQKLSSMPGLCGYATKNVSRHIQQQSTHTHTNLLIGYSTHLTYCKCPSLHLLHIYTGVYPWTCHKCACCCPIPHTGERKKYFKKINKHHQERACWQCAWKLRLLRVSNNLADEDSVITSL